MREGKYRDNRGIDYVRDLTVHRETQTEYNPYEELVMAIIVQAAADFRNGFKRNLYGFPIDPQIQRNFDDSKSFFYSNNFDGLIDVDGDYIMTKIINEERKKKRNMTENKKAIMKERVERAWKEWNSKQKRTKKTKPNIQKQSA